MSFMQVLEACSFRHHYAYATDRIGLNDREICQFMSNNRMTYAHNCCTKAQGVGADL